MPGPLDLDYYLNDINLSDIESIEEESRKSTSMDIYETKILLSSIDDYQKNIEKLENKINVLEMKLSFYQQENNKLIYQKEKFIKKTKPNILKRIYFYIIGKKYVIVE